MFFYGIMSQKPTCLYRGKDKNFVIVEVRRDKNTPVYELLVDQLTKQDALDICTQEDSGIAKMMLEMQLYGKMGNEENVTGKEKEILLALGRIKEAKTAIALIKSINAAPTKNVYDKDKFDEAQEREMLEEFQKSFNKGTFGYFDKF